MNMSSFYEFLTFFMASQLSQGKEEHVSEEGVGVIYLYSKQILILKKDQLLVIVSHSFHLQSGIGSTFITAVKCFKAVSHI